MSTYILPKFGIGTGLIYSTDLAGNFISPGIANTPQNADNITRDALNNSSLGFQRSAVGSIDFVTIGTDTINKVAIDGLNQFDITSPINISAGAEADAATALAQAVNSFIPTGPNYVATASGTKVFFRAPSSFGSSVNGDVVSIQFGIPASHTVIIEDIDGGQEGSELISQIYGLRYYLNPSVSAVSGSLTGATEITKYITPISNNNPPRVVSQTIADDSITIDREDRDTVVQLGASSNTDLKSIIGDFAIGDRVTLINSSAYTITPSDISLFPSGNLMLDPTTFPQLNDEYIITLMYLTDSVNGEVFKEIWRNKTTISPDSVTATELANLSVDTAAVQDLAITEAKLNDASVSAIKLQSDSVTTIKILDANVTTPKIADLNVTTPKIADSAITAIKLDTDSVTEPKILAGAVTLPKLGGNLSKGFFTFRVSWDSATELGITQAKIPFNLQVDEILISVADTIEASDDATLIAKDQTLAVMGSASITAGDVIGNAWSINPTVNNTFVAGEAMSFETIKTTPGGWAMCTICYTRL